MPRPIRALISCDAIRHNIGVARRSAPQARVWGVIKANAYGHGIERVLPALHAADGIALLDLDEAARVRASGYVGPILLLEGFFKHADLATIDRLRLTIVVHEASQLQMLEAFTPAQPMAVYLKINSGMNRLGFRADEAKAVHARLEALPQVSSVTFMTHFADADTACGTEAALHLFDTAIAGLAGARSMANSAATLIHPATHGDWIRPGIMLYGASPFEDRSGADLGLRPAMQLHSELIAIRELKAGDAVGYGGLFRAQQAMRVGVVACGYADGYPRVAPTGTPGWIEGNSVPLVGRVSMDMLTIDISAVPQACVGTPVELWGEHVPVDRVARLAGTSGYELLCALAPRVPTRTL